MKDIADQIKKDNPKYEHTVFKTGQQIMSKSAPQDQIDLVKKYFPDCEIICPIKLIEGL